MHARERISQDGNILKNRSLERWVPENLRPNRVGSQPRFVAEYDLEFIGVVCGVPDSTLGMEAFDGVCQDRVIVFEDRVLEGGVFEDLGPCWITGELGFVIEGNFELVGVVCCTLESVAFVYCGRGVSADEYVEKFRTYRNRGRGH